uniref:XapX domain-containing protein n=1 Tax=Parerythrobacter lutipelagi TaxID=1964208 RepID=UPI0010F95208
MTTAVGLLLAFVIGYGCRWFGLPLPAPPKLLGALLVITMTVGFLAAEFTVAISG